MCLQVDIVIKFPFKRNMACHVVKMRIHSAKNSIMYIIIIETTRPLLSSKCSVVYVIISESPETRLVPTTFGQLACIK